MHKVLSQVAVGSQALSYLLGVTVVVLVMGVYLTSAHPADLARQALLIFSPLYLVLLAGLVFATLFCWSHQRSLRDLGSRQVWTESALHAAGGVSTLALTFTLLGISLGIGTLSDQELTPQTVQGIISGLTRHFSMAFMTTVVGLPVSAALQALVRITEMNMASD